MPISNSDHYDVGIVGVSFGANFGSVLTYYSLARTIESFGKSVLMVSKIGASADDPEIQDTHAMRFAREHYTSSKIYNQDNVAELNNLVDTFVIGSDQVWNYGISRGFGKAFYLDFADDEKRKIAYAPSFGHAKDFAPEDEVPKISALLKRFNAISVREDSGTSLARDVYDVPAVQVADPIFLTNADVYRELSQRSQRDVSDPYLLAYILDPTPEKKAAIEHIAAKLGLKVRIILDAWPHLFQENKAKMAMDHAVEEDPNAYDFLKLFANSSYVITDSFHGTSFAIKFQKPFASIGNRRRGMARFDSLFRLVSHRHRFTLDPQEIIDRDHDFLDPMDYAQINAAVDRHVRESKKWLKGALKTPVRYTVGDPKLSWAERSGGYRTLLSGNGHVKPPKISVDGGNMEISRPAFAANSAAWTVSQQKGIAQIRVASPEYSSQRGNFIWTDLPQVLPDGSAYELSIEWRTFTTSPVINLHIVNPSTSKFKVIGTVEVPQGGESMRTDTIRFLVKGEGFSRIMLGAVHFKGENAGADISKIRLRAVPADTVPAKPAPVRKSSSEVVRMLGEADDARFIGSYAQHRVSRSVSNARALLMYHSHGIEKGLSRNTSFRPGVGQAAIPQLANEMNKWVAQRRDTDDPFFQIASAVMRTYFDRHRLLGVDVSHYWKMFDPVVQDWINKADTSRGGALAANIERDMKVDALPPRSFEDVVFSRRSVREYTDDFVDDGDIARAVTIAMQAPSVCNRQPVRVHQYEDPKKIESVLALQGGFRGYKLPPKLLLVTSDQAAFVAAVERNQAFIDGGLFMMLLLLGLEEVGLGAVSLNTAMGQEKELAIRKILNLPESESLISFIAVGHYDKATLVPRSQRTTLDQILHRH